VFHLEKTNFASYQESTGDGAYPAVALPHYPFADQGCVPLQALRLSLPQFEVLLTARHRKSCAKT